MNQQQPSRVRSALFQPPASMLPAADPAAPAQESLASADSVSAELAGGTEQAAEMPKPARRKRASRDGVMMTLQVRLPAAIHQALKIESIRRRQNVSLLVAKALVAQIPAVAAAARPAA